MKKGQKTYLWLLSGYVLALAILFPTPVLEQARIKDAAVCAALLLIVLYLAFFQKRAREEGGNGPSPSRPLRIRVCNRSGNELPAYATTASAGMDLRAFLEEPAVLDPGSRILIPTGLSIELPTGYEAQVRPRSGLAAKNGITVLNSPGTIDADYRGEIKVILVNLSQTPFTIRNGERIAQMVIAKHENIEWILAPDLTETERGQGGFGHTGKN